MLLKEAQEILNNKGYQLKKLNECGSFGRGAWRRPEKPSPDAEWIDGCGGGHWHVPNAQDKRRAAYNSKKHAAIGDKMDALKDELDELRSLRNKSISKQEAITIRECNKVLGQVLNKKLKTTFKGSGWLINDIKVLNLNLEVGYSFVASTDDYSWQVTATRYVGGAYEREWYITCQAPKGQKISSCVEKNSSYYKEQIKEYEKKLNDELDEILGNIKGFSTDYDTVKLDDRINAKEAELRKLSDDYDEENGWDKRRSEFKANLTPTGGLKKKIVRHESTEVADAKHLLESAGYICEVRTATTDDLELHADSSRTERKDVLKKITDYLKKYYGIVAVKSGTNKDVVWKTFKNECCIRVIKKAPYGSRKNAKKIFDICAEPDVDALDDGDHWFGQKLKGLTAKEVADAFVVWYKKMQILNNPKLRKNWNILKKDLDEYIKWDEHTEYAGLKKPLSKPLEIKVTPKYTSLRDYKQDLYDAICSRGVDYEIAMEYVEGIDAEFMRRHQNIDELADECQMEYGY